MTKTNRQTQADMMLLLVSLCWGVSYFMMDICLRDLGTFTLNIYRFVGAFLLIVLLFPKKMRHISRLTARYAVFVGIALYFTYFGATVGVQLTSQSNAGFLCAMSVVVTPVLDMLFKHRIPPRKLTLVVLACAAGIALMTLNESLHFNIGDVFCLGCAVANAAMAVIDETAVAREEVDAFQLGALSIGVCGLLCTVTALITETPHLPASPETVFCTVFLMIFCTGLPFIVQPIAQQYTSAVHVGVIFTMEPVFACFVAYMFAGERLLPRGYFGALILLLAMLWMEIDVGSLLEKRRKH
ncbi:MAG: DMT family transporter [Clostridiales bacterium]|nr:DMT family transporter [Clostridiales bacterium]